LCRAHGGQGGRGAGQLQGALGMLAPRPTLSCEERLVRSDKLSFRQPCLP
jgi:hypothetical protein